MGELSWHPGDPSPVPGPQERGTRRARRVRSTLGGLVLVGLAVAGTGVGWQQREVADEWRGRALLLEQQRDDAVGRAEALSDQLGELSDLVQLSAEDLVTLEERLAELAGEKALAEDRATVTREELRTLASTVESAVRQLNDCVDDLIVLQNDTVSAFNALGQGQSVDITLLNERLAEARSRCDAARQAGAEAVSLASRLR